MEEKHNKINKNLLYWKSISVTYIFDSMRIKFSRIKFATNFRGRLQIR